MIVLPSYPPRRAWLQSFGISISLVAGVALLMFWFLAGFGSRTLVAVLVLTMVLLFLAFRTPSLFAWPYRIWNRLAYAVSALVEWWSLRTIHWIIMLSAGESRKARQEIEMSGSRGDSSWRGRNSNGMGRPLEPVADSASLSLTQKTLLRSSSSRFAVLIDQWHRLDEIWAFRVLPSLYILAEVRTPEATQERQENIYTLF